MFLGEETEMNSFLKRVVYSLNRRGLLDFLSDKAYIKLMFRLAFNKKLNLESPKMYSEKLQWLKLYDRRDEYSTLVDKYEVKKYVADIVGENCIIPTLGVWTSFDEIDFEKLPNQFVLKCTHDSGGIVICKDKSKLNMEEAKQKIDKSLKTNYYKHGREWPYKNVKPRVIAEKYMEDSQTGELRDYKFFAFNGDVKAVFIASDRYSDEETKFDFFDCDFNHLPFTNGHPNAHNTPKKPKCFEEMKELASKLSVNIPHIRVDFYEVDGKVYFGEMTFFHWSGMKPFEPEEWDYKFGSWITLPNYKYM